MSFTLYPLRKQRSAALLPGGSGLQPDHDRPRPQERRRLCLPRLRRRRRAAGEGAGPEEHHPGAERARLEGRRQDGVASASTASTRITCTATSSTSWSRPVPSSTQCWCPRSACRPTSTWSNAHRQPDRDAKGYTQPGRHRSADRDAARHGQRRGHRLRSEPARVDAFRRRRLRRLQQGAHGRHRWP